jgi:hemoglobin
MRYVVLTLLILVAGCGASSGETKADPTPAVAKKALYERLGGKLGVATVVDDFVVNLQADPRIGPFFAGADVAHFKAMLADQICQVAGGPCQYAGRDMKTAHLGMGIREADFAALIDDLTKSLDRHQVGDAEKQELLGLLAPMKGDIVTR